MRGNAMQVARAAGVAGVLAAASLLLPSQVGLDNIKRFEGARSAAYLDAVQIPTICYGSTRDVRLGDTATAAECDTRLRTDATYAGVGVARHVTARVTQGQYDALVSFVFNVGETKFRRSTLLRKLNAGDCYGAGAEFDRWVYAGGKRLRGLVLRRASERAMWDAGCSLWG